MFTNRIVALRGWRSLLLVVAGLMAWSQSGVSQAYVSLGTVGDSYTHSYVFQSPRTSSRSWTDLLDSLKATSGAGVDGGGTGVWFDGSSFVTTAGGNVQYPSNWAIGGTNSADAINQLGTVSASGVNDLADQISNGEIDVAVVATGLNDLMVDNPTTADMNNTVANIETIIKSMRTIDPGLPIVLANIPDGAATPYYRNTPEATTMRDLIVKANSLLQTFADNRKIPVANWFGISDLGLTNFTPSGSNVTLLNTDGGSSDANPDTYFWADQYHPTTLPQALMANVIVDAMKQAYPTQTSGADLLSSSFILNTYLNDSNDSFAFKYGNYVLTPSPASGGLLVLGVLVLLPWRRRKSRVAVLAAGGGVAD